ncbi:MAG TPA: hypothetical protein VGX03_14420 [Candidatus Binatia bacterium]|nr:hypothetical protein [Candidatus Binatia bacterium]
MSPARALLLLIGREQFPIIVGLGATGFETRDPFLHFYGGHA